MFVSTVYTWKIKKKNCGEKYNYTYFGCGEKIIKDFCNEVKIWLKIDVKNVSFV